MPQFVAVRAVDFPKPVTATKIAGGQPREGFSPPHHVPSHRRSRRSGSGGSGRSGRLHHFPSPITARQGNRIIFAAARRGGYWVRGSSRLRDFIRRHCADRRKSRFTVFAFCRIHGHRRPCSSGRRRIIIIARLWAFQNDVRFRSLLLCNLIVERLRILQLRLGLWTLVPKEERTGDADQ